MDAKLRNLPSLSRFKKLLSVYFKTDENSIFDVHNAIGIKLLNRLTVLKTVLSKTNRTIGLLRKLQNLLPREALIIIYKAFVRPHLDYGDVLFDQAFNASFHEKLESIQYNACLALTGTIRGTSKEKLYQEVGLESLQLRRWYRKLLSFL